MIFCCVIKMDFNEFTPPSTSSTSHLNLFKFKRRDMIYLIFWWLSESVISFLICIRTRITINKFSDNLQTSQSLHSCRFFSLKVLSVIGRKWDCSVIIKIGDSKNLPVKLSEIQHLSHKYFFRFFREFLNKSNATLAIQTWWCAFVPYFLIRICPTPIVRLSIFLTFILT